MSDKICHLCGISYNDDPHLAEQPAHTLKKCLSILEYRLRELESKHYEAERTYVRAKLEYGKREKL